MIMEKNRGRVIKEYIYKGHMDKVKGGKIKGGRQGWVGGGEWWRENGDNCT